MVYMGVFTLVPVGGGLIHHGEGKGFISPHHTSIGCTRARTCQELDINNSISLLLT